MGETSALPVMKEEVVVKRNECVNNMLSEEEQFNRGVRLFEERKFVEAIEPLSMILANGEYPEARKYLARCYFRLEKYETALRHFQILAELPEWKDYAISIMAAITSIRGDYDGALKLMEKLPQTINNLINLSVMYWQKYKAEGRKDILLEAWALLDTLDMNSINPDFHWRIHLSRGMILQALNNYYQAEAHYRQALKCTKDKVARAKVLNEYGYLYIDLGNYSKAEKILNAVQIICLDSRGLEKAYNYKYRGILEQKRGKPQEAKSYFDTSLRIFSELKVYQDIREINHLKAMVVLENKRGIEAEKPVRSEKPQKTAVKRAKVPKAKAVNADPLSQGIKLFQEGKYIEAIDLLSALLNEGENEKARQYLARCYHRLEKYETAYKHFQQLAENSDSKTREYGYSMLASIEIVWGNYNKAIKTLKSLPPTTNNLINLCVLYWQKFKVEGDELSIREALKILDKIHVDNAIYQKRIYHLKALIYQTLKNCKLARSFYDKAISLAENDIARGRILNDFASLAIECESYANAEKLLLEARQLVQGKSEIQEAFNDKWMGILARKQRKYEAAKKYLENAVKIIKEKGLIQEVAEINFILAELSKEGNFYKAAEYFAEGVISERLIKEVKNQDEKVLDLYFDSFISDPDDSASSS